MANMTAERFVQRLGKTAEGGRVVVEVEIRAQAGSRPTVTHETITDPTELSVQGERFEKGDHRYDPSSAGQIRESLADITEPAPGWSLDEIRELGQIWGRWHLNTVKAGCAHMPADARARWDRRERVECSEGSGYTYGSAWLTEPIPSDVLDRVRYLMRDRSADLYRARGYDASGKPFK